MESQTFRSRLAELMQKSRKALRLYSSMVGNQSQLNELQITQWREINQDLLKHLAAALEISNPKQVVVEVFALRDRFYSLWRTSESSVHVKQQELIRAAEHGDFVKAGLLAQELVTLRAKEQASQAAHHELQEILGRSRMEPPTIELSADCALPDQALPNRALQEPESTGKLAKVIPLRSRA